MEDQNELQRGLGRVEGKLDALLEHLKGSDKRHGELETRVRKVEGRQLYYNGAAVAVAYFLAKVDFTKLISIAHASGVAG